MKVLITIVTLLLLVESTQARGNKHSGGSRHHGRYQHYSVYYNLPTGTWWERRGVTVDKSQERKFEEIQVPQGFNKHKGQDGVFEFSNLPKGDQR